jgi:hypothetical protein
VLDGHVLYVDNNCDGDLTEAGKRLEGRHESDGRYVFDVCDIAADGVTHRKVTVCVGEVARLAEDLRDRPEYQKLIAHNPGALAKWISAEVAMPGRHGAAGQGRVLHVAGPVDAHGILQFASDFAEAPVIHFGGAWSMTTYGKPVMIAGERNELTVSFGTPGSGAGTFAYAAYEGLVPDTALPVVDLVFPARRAGAEPAKVHGILEARC